MVDTNRAISIATMGYQYTNNGLHYSEIIIEDPTIGIDIESEEIQITLDSQDLDISIDEISLDIEMEDE